MEHVYIVMEGFAYEGYEDVDSVWPTEELALERVRALATINADDGGVWHKVIKRPLGR